MSRDFNFGVAHARGCMVSVDILTRIKAMKDSLS